MVALIRTYIGEGVSNCSQAIDRGTELVRSTQCIDRAVKPTAAFPLRRWADGPGRPREVTDFALLAYCCRLGIAMSHTPPVSGRPLPEPSNEAAGPRFTMIFCVLPSASFGLICERSIEKSRRVVWPTR
jgi:hypothetical protein